MTNDRKEQKVGGMGDQRKIKGSIKSFSACDTHTHKHTLTVKKKVKRLGFGHKKKDIQL